MDNSDERTGTVNCALRNELSTANKKCVEFHILFLSSICISVSLGVPLLRHLWHLDFPLLYYVMYDET